MTHPKPTAPVGDLTRLQQHLYAAGHFGVSFLGLVIPQWLMKFYFPNDPGVTNLVPALLAPWIMFLGRLTDGLNDPLVGYLSDSVRTRWGRRKPFMAAGLPFLFLFFLLLWYPPAPQAESAGNFWFSTLVLVFFFLAFTVYTGPYLALLPEITRTPEQRLQLSALQGIYNVSGLIASSFITGAALKAEMSYQGMAWWVVGLSLMAFVLPLLGAGDDPERVTGQERPALIRSVAMTLTNRPFLIYVVSKVLFLTGLLLLVSALPYMVVTLLRQPQGEAGILTGIALLSGMLCVQAILKAAHRWGRKAAYLFSMLWLAGSSSLLILMPLFGGLPWGVWLMRGLLVLSSVGVAGLFALPYAFLADVTDYERQRTGLDRQGMFFCVQGLITKAAYGTAPLIVTGLLALFHRHSAVALTLIGPLSGVLSLAAYAVFRAFPEDEVRQAVLKK